jgi:hypothetical protein
MNLQMTIQLDVIERLLLGEAIAAGNRQLQRRARVVSKCSPTHNLFIPKQSAKPIKNFKLYEVTLS